MERGVDERGISADDQRQRDVEHVATGGFRVDTDAPYHASRVGRGRDRGGGGLTNAVSATDEQAADTGQLRRWARERR